VVTITGYEDVPENSEISLLKALAHQPVSVGIAAGSKDLQFYKGVSKIVCLYFPMVSQRYIFVNCNLRMSSDWLAAQGVFDGACSAELDHALTAVGYGSSYGQDYIVMKNSWGMNWGEQGFVRIKKGTGKPEGVCGIYAMASYPVKNATHWGGVIL